MTIRTITIVMVMAGWCSLAGAAKPPVLEVLDERTGVTLTLSRTHLTLSEDEPYSGSSRRDYVDMAPVKVNRTGKFSYFLWVGISIAEAEPKLQPSQFRSIVVVADDRELELSPFGWTPAAIGASAPLYKKLYNDSIDAYYPITLSQLRELAAAETLTLRTTGPGATEYIPWFNVKRARQDLLAFLAEVGRYERKPASDGAESAYND